MSVKNFALGLEWIWTEEKFLDRKNDMSEYYLDFKDNGKVDEEKFAVSVPQAFCYFFKFTILAFINNFVEI